MYVVNLVVIIGVVHLCLCMQACMCSLCRVNSSAGKTYSEQHLPIYYTQKCASVYVYVCLCIT